MKNISKVIWSAEAVENLEKIIAYLEANWTEKEIRKFVKKLEKQITVIKKQPLSFPKSQLIEARKSVLSKHTTIFYKVCEDAIFIVTIFDNRQNPENLK
ncbi:MAG TPA: type II toxin-antitoxin system RelE/ParE family toxin [Bacteroidales bacterium]|nr:type II toxin-antitoxin system RelE/ParE family toxin [Bacteroidales bacterium]